MSPIISTLSSSWAPTSLKPGPEFTRFVTGNIADNVWNKSTWNNPQSSAYAHTGWRDFTYTIVNNTMYRYPSSGYSFGFSGTPTVIVQNIGDCREFGVIRNSLVFSGSSGANINTNTLHIVDLDANGNMSGNKRTLTLGFNYDGIITTTHYDYLGFILNGGSTIQIVKCTFNPSGYLTNTSASSGWTAGSDSATNYNYNGTGGYYDHNSGYLYTNRWNNNSGAYIRQQGPTINAAGQKTGSTNFTNISFRTTNISSFSESISCSGNPYKGQIFFAYHGDGHVIYSDPDKTTSYTVPLP